MSFEKASRLRNVTLSNLTGIRGVAAYSVLLAHSIDTTFFFAGVPVFHDVAAHLAYFGMSLFFVLSGFVIQYNYADSFRTLPYFEALKRFYVARFARLYPLYIVFLLICLAYIPSPYFAGKSIAFLSFLTLTQSWFNYQSITFAPAWSISTEWFFYLAFVLILPFGNLVRGVRNTILFTAICVPLLAGAVFWAFMAKSGVAKFWTAILPANPTSDSWSWFQYYSPYFRLAEFLMGALSAKLFVALSERPSSSGEKIAGQIVLWSSVCFLFFLMFSTRIPSMPTWPFLSFLAINFGWAPAIACILFCTSRYKSSLAAALSSRIAVNAGELSYSVYILQFWIFTMLGGFVSAAASPLAYFNSSLKLMLIVALTTVFAYGSFNLIEDPSRRWIRQKLTPRER